MSFGLCTISPRSPQETFTHTRECSGDLPKFPRRFCKEGTGPARTRAFALNSRRTQRNDFQCIRVPGRGMLGGSPRMSSHTQPPLFVSPSTVTGHPDRATQGVSAEGVGHIPADAELQTQSCLTPKYGGQEGGSHATSDEERRRDMHERKDTRAPTNTWP